MPPRLGLAELLQKLRENDESVEIEAKRARELGPSILHTVCAFANEPGLGGGYLVLGVEEDAPGLFGRMYRVTGVSDPEKLQTDLATQCANVFNVPVRPEISVETDPATRARALVVFVPESDAAVKPVHIEARGLPRGAFRRISSTDQECTADDLTVFYQERGLTGVDESVVGGATFDDLDPQAFDAYRRYRTEFHANAPELTFDDADLAVALDAARRVNSGALIPTVAGLVCFGTRAALRRLFPSWRIDYVRVPGTEWLPDAERRFQAVSELREPLMTAIPKALATIADAIPRAFSLPGMSARRAELPLVPHRALREALVNAVMHRSYRRKEAVLIIHYSNRLEIINPGASLVADERLGEPGSTTRNEKIAAVLHETHFAEEKGSGIRTMRSEMRDAGLMPPILTSDRTRDQFSAVFMFHHFLSAGDLQWLSNYASFGLSEDDARALIVVRETGAITNATYRSFSGVDTLTASARLRALRDKELLVPRGKGAGTYYVAGPAFVPQYRDEGATVGPEAAPRNISRAPRRSAVDIDALRAAFPEPLQRRLATLGRRTALADLQSVVLDLLRAKTLTSHELSLLTGKARNSLLLRVINPLISAGLVEPTIGPTRYHRAQAYRAKK